MANLAFRNANPATDQSQTTSAISVNKPTGTVQDDLLDATFVTFIASPAAAPTHTLPSGWQVAASGTFTLFGGAYNCRVTRAYKIAGASEGASYSFSASANCVLTVDIRAYDNPDTATPLNVASSISTFSGSSALSCPSVTTTTANALIVGACVSDGTSGALVTYTSAALTERTDSSSLWSGDVIQAAAGASGTKAVTASASGAGFTITVAYNSDPTLTASLSGQSATSAAGSLGPQTSKGISGQALAGTQGAATPATSKSITGQAVTGATGAVAPDVQIALTGQAISVGQGALAVNVGGDVTLALSGQALTSAAGTLGPATSKAIAGSAISSAAGALIPDASAVLAGQALALAQGTITFAGDVTVALTGLSMTLGQGFLSTPDAVREGPTPAGKSRRRSFVEIDGQEFEVRDVQHAQALLDRAREVAVRHAQELAAKAVPVTRKVGRRPIALPTPRISSPDPELKEVVRKARQKINAVYKQTALDTELAYLMARQLEQDDEEEALLLLM